MKRIMQQFKPSTLSLVLSCSFLSTFVYSQDQIDHLTDPYQTDEISVSSEFPTLDYPLEFQQKDWPTSDENSLGWINYVPRMVDATPTLFPEQSNKKIYAPTQATEDLSWIDRRQKSIRQWADRTAQRIDGWFGEGYEDETAKATLRVIFDNKWNKYDDYEFKPRIRGKIDLPTLERKLSLVFGDDSLDNEIDNNIAITNENPAGDPDKNVDTKRIREDNSSIALRWSQLSDKLPFDLDADLGIRSGDDIYARLKAKKDWTLGNDFSFHAEQIYRYGIDSENYLRTNLELTHARPNEAFISNQLYLTYADEQDDDWTWDNRTYRQHQFFHDNRFNYGMYVGGYYNEDDLRMNSWGPFVSWRQPLFREWFFVQGDLNYFNDKREDRSHYPRALVRLEARF
ncbi:hypothetical protein [Acinetobacter sp. YH12239]|uniref:hypothetical protein n=1 Tax=Acinetobacter sp. YH12239 TaxID=2601166 RepID=UPI00211DFE15|nr:hypothetical protein [Acinetobacter sp. YH12239]